MSLDADVIIVGAGPVGLTLAVLLDTYNVSTILLEKRESLQDIPRAVSIDDEVMRVWQHCDILESIRPFIISGKEGDKILSYHDAKGREFLNIQQSLTEYGHPLGSAILQTPIENAFFETIKKRKGVKVYLSHRVESIDNNEDDVCASGLMTNSKQFFLFKAKYLVGCDGASSIVRKLINTKLCKRWKTGPWLIINALVDGGVLRGGRVWCHPTRAVVNIPLPQQYQRWECQLTDRDVDLINNKNKNVNDFIKSYGVDKNLKFVSSIVHSFEGGVVRRYSVGNVFLAGDAAHVTPPFMGQGLSCGIRDAFNLAWKLSYVCKGFFGEKILDSYQQERQSHQKSILRKTRLMGYVMSPPSKLISILLFRSLRILAKYSSINRLLTIRGDNIRPLYDKGYVKAGGKAGSYIIQPFVLDRGGCEVLMDELFGVGFVLLAFGVAFDEILNVEEQNHWSRLGATRLVYDQDFKDFKGAFSDWLEIHKKRLLIIRPDKFILEDRVFD